MFSPQEQALDRSRLGSDSPSGGEVGGRHPQLHLPTSQQQQALAAATPGEAGLSFACQSASGRAVHRPTMSAIPSRMGSKIGEWRVGCPTRRAGWS